MAKKPRAHKQSKGKSKHKNALLIYPGWAKALVCLVVAGWLSGIVLFTCGMQSCITSVRQWAEPAYIAASLKKITGIEKLPAGFKPIFAACLSNFSMLSLSYEPDDSGIMLWICPVEQLPGSSRELTDSMAKKAVHNLTDEKTGAIPVAGEKLEYVTGIALNGQGDKVGCLIGSAILKNKRVLIIYGWTPPRSNKQQKSPDAGKAEKVSFNMDALNSFLSAIKSF
jgi:hypothetical protein